MVISLLIFMFFLGVVQVIWAIVHAIATRDPWVRMQFGMYGLGVAGYFLVLGCIYAIEGDGLDRPLFSLHFFGGAFALAVYHLYITVNGFRRRAQRRAEPFADELQANETLV